MYRAETERQLQEKTITVTNLSSKEISPREGQSFKAFTVYSIQGNDGITYETSDRDTFTKMIIGSPATIKFFVETKTSNGRVYTHYKIPTPVRKNRVLEELEKGILDKVSEMIKGSEDRIMTAISSIKGVASRPETVSRVTTTVHAAPIPTPQPQIQQSSIDDEEDLSDLIPFE